MEKNLGHATAYGYAKSKGYSGTEDEFADLMADYASVGQSAAQSAEQAAASATSASGSAATASQAAQSATSKASEAVTAADTATTKASEASTSADTASAAATSASTSAQTATTAASTATTKASEAAVSANTASTAKTDAESARDAATQSASRAEQSAESIDPDEFNRKIYAAFATDTASGSIVSFADGADNIPMKDVLVHIEPVQAGSGDPSPDNVRLITGWTGAKVTRTGINVWDEEWELGLLNSDGSVSSGVRVTSKNYIPVVPNKMYCFSLPDGIYAAGRGAYYDADKNLVQYLGSFPTNFSHDGDRQFALFTVPENASYLKFCANAQYGATYNNDISINYPSTDTDYHSGTDNETYSITFPIEAGTVYGGTLDVTNGELIVNKVMVTLDGTRALAPNGKTSISSRFGLNVAGKAVGERNILSNMFYAPPSFVDSVGSVYGRVASNYVEFFLPPDIEQTTAAGKAWFAENPTQLCYELATPITYQLNPQEITSLLGTNNLWADTGNSEVEYRADTTLYISRLTEPDADMIADANIVSGQYFMVGNSLYRATSNIASGASVIVGTNAVKVSLATALNEINQ